MFDDRDRASMARDECRAAGMNVELSCLGPGAAREVERVAVLLRRDWLWALAGAVGGGLVGGLIGLLQAWGVANLPLLLPWTAGGAAAAAVAGLGAGAALWGLVGGLFGLVAPLPGVRPGQAMLTVFFMRGQRPQADRIIRRLGGRRY